MEKENKKARDDAKKEYNESVRVWQHCSLCGNVSFDLIYLGRTLHVSCANVIPDTSHI